jgi:hypothetical protein
MDSLHVDYLTSDATELKISLISPGPLETPYSIDLELNEWQSVNIPLSAYSDIVDLQNVFQLKVDGNGTVLLDNIYFYNDNISSSNEANSDNLPESVTLSQNYPNPFNPSTNIEFGIPKTASVSLIIYNLLGQKMTTLVDSRLSAGNYSMNWNASNRPSGIYFYQLVSGDVVVTKKMFLLK